MKESENCGKTKNRVTWNIFLGNMDNLHQLSQLKLYLCHQTSVVDAPEAADFQTLTFTVKQLGEEGLE